MKATSALTTTITLTGPGSTKLTVTVTGLASKTLMLTGLSFKDVDDHELSRNRRRRRPISESILAVHLADLQRLVAHDLGTTSQF